MALPPPSQPYNPFAELERVRRERDERLAEIEARRSVVGAPQPMVRGAPAATRVTPNVFTEAARAGVMPAPVNQESSGFLARAGRFVTGVLSPLQLPQDIFFASLAGMMDRERSVMDYLGDLEWGNYTPWTPAPIRNVTGEQLLMMSGLQDERARQVLGFGLDIFADPLFGGAVLRGVAKVGNVASLNRVADVMDTVAESTMLAGALPTVRVAQAARKIPGFRQMEDAVMDNFVRKTVMPVLEPLLEQSITIPVSGRKFNLAGMFRVDGGRMEGAQEVVARAGATAEELGENVGVLLARADAAAGGSTWKRIIAAQQRKMAVMYDIPIEEMNKLSPELTQAIMTSAGSTANDLGYVTLRMRGGESVAARGIAPSASPEMQRALRDIEQMENVMGLAPLSREQAIGMAQRRGFYDSERERLMEMATRYGADPAKVGNIFDEVVHRFGQIGAMEGYFASGYGPMRERFFETMASRLSSLSASNPGVRRAIRDAGGEGNVIGQAWKDLLASSPRGYAKEALDYNVRFAGAEVAGDAGRFTYRQMFGDYNNIPGLDLGDYLDSLTRGHMRRTFGMFQDDDSWRVAVERLNDGRIASSRILNEPVVYEGVAQAGFKAEADVLKRYLDDMMPRTYGGRAAGAFVRQEDVLEHMVRQGVAPERAEEFWRAVHRAQDPYVADLADRVATYGRTRVTAQDPTQVLSARRQNLNQDEVETLFELSNPLLSRAETSIAATSAARRMEGVTGILRLAEQQGLILDTASAAAGRAPRWWKNVKGEEASALPALAGKTVHPMVYREIHNLVGAGRNPAAFTSGLQRVRSIISGGYLASPATTAANIAGGFWTAMEYGINPVKLMQNMAEVYRDWKQVGRELPELAHTRDILEGGLSQMDVLRAARDLPSSIGSDLRTGVNAFSDVLRDAAQKYEDFLRKPFGQGALGLGLFQASESLFRLGTFRMVMKETGGNIQEARRAARFVVFDYASQPGVIQAARDTGVFMFPAFPYFMVGRTIKAARERPGLLASADRLPEAIGRMVVPDENQRSAMLMGMEDWERDDKFIPIRKKANGDVSMLPLNQLMPTNTLTGAPFADSLKTLGLWGPLIDMMTSFVSLGGQERGDVGMGRFTGEFGRRVLPTGVSDWTDTESVLKGFGTFFYNSFAPAIARKLVRAPEDIQQNWEGIVPQLVRSATTVPAEWMYTGRSPREVLTGRADQDFLDSVLSFSVRSTRNIITEGPLATSGRLLERAQANLQSDLNKIDQRIRILVAEGKMPAALEQQQVRDRMVQRYWDRWGDQITEMQRLAQTGQFNVPR